MAYFERRVSFDHERDSDIIEFLDSMTSHKANQLIRQLVRDYIKDERHTQVDRIETKLDRLLRHINNIDMSAKKEAIAVNNGDDGLIDKLSDNLENIGV